MPHRADPGGVFASDTHRRVLAHIAPHEQEKKTRDTIATLSVHLLADPHSPDLTEEDVEEVVKDLEADGYVQVDDDKLAVTSSGSDALSAPVGGVSDGE